MVLYSIGRVLMKIITFQYHSGLHGHRVNLRDVIIVMGIEVYKLQDGVQLHSQMELVMENI